MSNTLDRGYNGNANLKRKGTPIEFTQDMVGEFIKCANNPTYFSEKYIQIVHVDHGLIPRPVLYLLTKVMRLVRF